ncbi:MAG: polymorphic toxin type 44 domain-containing protein [Chloroflexi bacterium]|nr:polymorphic toxin type 44 domain-containing protein [Chloroflexota bacterium]
MFMLAGQAIAVSTRTGTTGFSDHLGSASTMTTTGGSVVHQARFLPFGGSRGWGSAPTAAWLDRGYTGHLHNDGVGLIYMNARYYVPSLGRFASADTIVPDTANPQSFNRYSYVYNNPINHTDPTGHCLDALSTAVCLLRVANSVMTVALGKHIDGLDNWNPFSYPMIGERVSAPTNSDMTTWLVDQMVTTSNSSTVATMRDQWSSQSIPHQHGVLSAWTSLVRSGGIWDFKVDILSANLAFGDNDLVILGGVELNYQAVANIFYGFIGRQIGMKESLLQLGAGAAQFEWGWDHWYGNLQANPAGFGDQPFDAWSVGFGFYLYNLYGQNIDALTPDAFAQAFAIYIQDNPMPDLP